MREYDLTAGVLDGAAEAAFLEGACGGLALVLHEATGWPLVAITDAHNADPFRPGWVGGGSALHYGVRRPVDGAFIDVLGAHRDEDALEEYGAEADDGEAYLGLTREDDVREWYIEAQGEPVPMTLIATFVEAVLARSAQ